MTAVAVFDADAPGALAFVRSLGRKGVPTTVYSHQRVSTAGVSRYCGGRQWCPPQDQEETFHAWLSDEIRAKRIRLVAPTSDTIAYHVAQLLGDLGPAARGGYAELEPVLTCLFKDRYEAACEDFGQSTPWSAAPRSMEDFAGLEGTLPFPVIIKPRSHIGAGLTRGKVVHSPSEVAAHYGPYPETPSNRQAFERYPELQWPMLEAYVPGALKHLYSVSGLLGPDGRVIACSASRKTIQWPPDLGIGIVFESYEDPGLIERGVALVRHLAGKGIFEVEFILDERTGEYVSIDLNPRAHGHVALDIARGHDLPWLWYQCVQGHPSGPVGAPTSPMRWIHGIPLAIHGVARLLRDRELPRELVAGGPSIDVVYDPWDPAPGAVFSARLLRHPGGLIRPLWRGSQMG